MKPQPLPQSLLTDISQIKTLLDEKFVGLNKELKQIQELREDAEEYRRQISKLQKYSNKVLGFDDYKPNAESPEPKKTMEEPKTPEEITPFNG